MAEANARIIVLPLDGSYHSEYAFKFYCDQIKRDNDYVVISSTFDRHSYGIYAYGTADANEIATQLQTDIDKHKEQCDRFTQKLTEAKLKGEVVQGAGKAGECAIKVAHERNATMIVVGYRGHNAVRRTILGSTSEYIMHHSDIPVVICRHKPHQNPMTQEKH